jgi:hypothetical protein
MESQQFRRQLKNLFKLWTERPFTAKLVSGWTSCLKRVKPLQCRDDIKEMVLGDIGRMLQEFQGLDTDELERMCRLRGVAAGSKDVMV